jgi:hypothetical protein
MRALIVIMGDPLVNSGLSLTGVVTCFAYPVHSAQV